MKHALPGFVDIVEVWGLDNVGDRLEQGATLLRLGGRLHDGRLRSCVRLAHLWGATHALQVGYNPPHAAKVVFNGLQRVRDVLTTRTG